MAFLDISVFLHEFMLDFFKLRTVDFLDPAASYTNEMVMVLMAVLVLVTKGTFSKVHLPADAGIAHELDRSGHGGIANPLMPASDEIIQLLNGYMSFGGQKCIQYLVSLLSASESLLSNEFLKLFSRIHRTQSLTSATSIS